jgi:enoyl-CoA hydratase
VSPLAASAAVEIQHRLGGSASLLQALKLEYRFTWRAQDQSDFLEGIRAAIIDKDRKPRWLHASADAVPAADVAKMLAPLGLDEWTLEEQT